MGMQRSGGLGASRQLRRWNIIVQTLQGWIERLRSGHLSISRCLGIRMW